MEFVETDYEHCTADAQVLEGKPDRPVDLVHLARQTLGDKALECEVLELFRRQSVANLEKLQQVETEEAWKTASHRLKGAARAIGAWPVADIAEKAERLAGDELVRRRDQLLEALEMRVAAANDYILSLLRNE